MPQLANHGRRNRVRIIGGSLRGQIVRFPDADGLRPTGNRIRETLFNWLQQVIPGARCLDLFAGSGALGIEALSRGASAVQFVESNRTTASILRGNLGRLGLAPVRANVATMPAQEWMQRADQRTGFDVIFLDPPFQQQLAIRSCHNLADAGLLRTGAVLYLEGRDSISDTAIPDGFSLFKSGQGGQVGYRLLHYRASGC